MCDNIGVNTGGQRSKEEESIDGKKERVKV
jgi:hypothetical protein